ncbi:MAG: hypothetical protein Q4F75_07145 [Pseudomonadota bacterium]|nr:hypothetical protein [Pseudomonadota bacterium]
MKIKFLLIGTSLSLIPNLLYAQCAETDCLKLGYTKLEKCNNGLKCPFGEYWACPCDSSYQYTCTGANEQPGTDKCGNTYKLCNCADGYEWKDGKCEILSPLGRCSGNAKNCKIGQILNSDGICTSDKVSGKEPLGVVVAIKDNCGWAIATKKIPGYIQWSTEYIDTGVFQSMYVEEEVITDFNVANNMQKIIQASNGDSNKYPAVYAALNYTPSEAPETKGKWALPTAGILNNLYTYFNAINGTLIKIGGSQIVDYREEIWSSTEQDNRTVWFFWKPSNENGRIGAANKDSERNVRPVIAF